MKYTMEVHNRVTLRILQAKYISKIEPFCVRGGLASDSAAIWLFQAVFSSKGATRRNWPELRYPQDDLGKKVSQLVAQETAQTKSLL